MVTGMAQERALAGTHEAPDGVATAKGQATEIELSRAQQAVARRTAESKATIPHLALQCDIDMQECTALRAELQTLAAGRRIHDDTGPATARTENADAVPTYDDMVVKACALALREQPRVNSSYRDGRLQLHSRINVGVTLWAEPDDSLAGAPITPTVFDADLKSVDQIAREIRHLAARARDGSIAPPDLGGATFTVSSLGTFGVSSFTAIVNPPQAAILAVGTVGPRPVARALDEDSGTRIEDADAEIEGAGAEVVVREAMTVTLACDHRVLDGGGAARFLQRVRELLERPRSLTP